MTIKLNAATGGGSVSLSAPNSTTSNLDVELTLPVDDGAANTFLKSDGSGTLSWASASSDSITEGNTSVECVDTGSNGHITFDTEGSERMRIDSAGDILVSKTGAANGSNTDLIVLDNDNSSNSDNLSTSIAFKRTGNSASNIYGRISSVRIGTHDSDLAFSFNYGGSTAEAMRIVAGGNQGTVVMGDTSASRTADTGHKFRNTTPSIPIFTTVTDDNVPSARVIETYNVNASYNGVRFIVRLDGGIENYQSNNSNLCDEREKRDIVDLDSTWDCLKHWELKKFHYITDAQSDPLRYGVIAQQIVEHCPEVVTDFVTQPGSEAVINDAGTVIEPAQEEIVRLGVREQQMYWMAIKALQEAQTRIETLETANASLEARLTALEGGAS